MKPVTVQTQNIRGLSQGGLNLKLGHAEHRTQMQLTLSSAMTQLNVTHRLECVLSHLVEFKVALDVGGWAHGGDDPLPVSWGVTAVLLLLVVPLHQRQQNHGPISIQQKNRGAIEAYRVGFVKRYTKAWA